MGPIIIQDKGTKKQMQMVPSNQDNSRRVYMQSTDYKDMSMLQRIHEGWRRNPGLREVELLPLLDLKDKMREEAWKPVDVICTAQPTKGSREDRGGEWVSRNSEGYSVQIGCEPGLRTINSGKRIATNVAR